MVKDVLNETEAATYLGISPGTLRNSRKSGSHGRIQSPKFFRIGRLIRYAREDLDAWLRAYREGHSSNETQPA